MLDISLHVLQVQDDSWEVGRSDIAWCLLYAQARRRSCSKGPKYLHRRKQGFYTRKYDYVYGFTGTRYPMKP